jgi:apolipoprotein N-acyltransferase
MASRTQMDALPLVQSGSVTGLWGVTFLVLAVSSGAAVALFARRWTTPVTVGLAASGGLVARFNDEPRRRARRWSRCSRAPWTP